MSNEFDVQYDNVSSKSAPALDDYEKSVFLTRGMYKILDSLIGPYIKEQQTIQAEAIKKLITSYETTTVLPPSPERIPITANAVFYTRANDTYNIILEQAELRSQDPYVDGSVAQVVPIAYDRFHRTIRNPYLGAQEDRVLRLDSGYNLEEDVVQLIPSENATIDKYFITYIKKPYPIIISDLSLLYPGEDLSVYGETLPYSVTTEATDVSEIVHDEIIKEAVSLAILHFRENSLSNNVNIN